MKFTRWTKFWRGLFAKEESAARVNNESLLELINADIDITGRMERRSGYNHWPHLEGGSSVTASDNLPDVVNILTDFSSKVQLIRYYRDIAGVAYIFVVSNGKVYAEIYRDNQYVWFVINPFGDSQITETVKRITAESYLDTVFFNDQNTNVLMYDAQDYEGDGWVRTASRYIYFAGDKIYFRSNVDLDAVQHERTVASISVTGTPNDYFQITGDYTHNYAVGEIVTYKDVEYTVNTVAEVAGNTRVTVDESLAAIAASDTLYSNYRIQIENDADNYQGQAIYDSLVAAGFIGAGASYPINTSAAETAADLKLGYAYRSKDSFGNVKFYVLENGQDGRNKNKCWILEFNDQLECKDFVELNIKASGIVLNFAYYNDNIYIASQDGRVEVLDINNQFSNTAITSGDIASFVAPGVWPGGSLAYVYSIAVDASGIYLYSSDLPSKSDWVQFFSSSDNFQFPRRMFLNFVTSVEPFAESTTPAVLYASQFYWIDNTEIYLVGSFDATRADDYFAEWNNSTASLSSSIRIDESVDADYADHHGDVIAYASNGSGRMYFFLDTNDSSPSSGKGPFLVESTRAPASITNDDEVVKTAVTNAAFTYPINDGLSYTTKGMAYDSSAKVLYLSCYDRRFGDTLATQAITSGQYTIRTGNDDIATERGQFIVEATGDQTPYIDPLPSTDSPGRKLTLSGFVHNNANVDLNGDYDMVIVPTYDASTNKTTFKFPNRGYQQAGGITTKGTLTFTYGTEWESWFIIKVDVDTDLSAATPTIIAGHNFKIEKTAGVSYPIWTSENARMRQPGRIVFDGTYIWVVDDFFGSVMGIDPSIETYTSTLIQTTPEEGYVKLVGEDSLVVSVDIPDIDGVTETLTDIVYASSANEVWCSSESGNVYVIDISTPASATLTHSMVLSGGAVHSLSIDEDDVNCVWALDRDNSIVHQIGIDNKKILMTEDYSADVTNPAAVLFDKTNTTILVSGSDNLYIRRYDWYLYGSSFNKDFFTSATSSKNTMVLGFDFDGDFLTRESGVDVDWRFALMMEEIRLKTTQLQPLQIRDDKLYGGGTQTIYSFTVVGGANGSPSVPKAVYFEISGSWTWLFPAGNIITISGSTGNDGDYTCEDLAEYQSGSDRTRIYVEEAIPSGTFDGNLNLKNPDKSGSVYRIELGETLLSGLTFSHYEVYRHLLINDDLVDKISLQRAESSEEQWRLGEWAWRDARNQQNNLFFADDYFANLSYLIFREIVGFDRIEQDKLKWLGSPKVPTVTTDNDLTPSTFVTGTKMRYFVAFEFLDGTTTRLSPASEEIEVPSTSIKTILTNLNLLSSRGVRLYEDADVTEIQLYRSDKASGSTEYLNPTYLGKLVKNSNGDWQDTGLLYAIETWEDNVGSLIYNPFSDGTARTYPCEDIVVHKNRLVLVNQTNYINSNVIAYSDIDLPQAIPPTNIRAIQSGDGDTLYAGHSMKDYLFLFKENKVYGILGDVLNGQLVDVDPTIGTRCKHAIGTFNDIVYFMSRSGIYRIAELRVQSLSEGRLDDFFDPGRNDSIDFENVIEQAFVYVDEPNREIYFFFPQKVAGAVQTTNNTVLVYSTKLNMFRSYQYADPIFSKDLVGDVRTGVRSELMTNYGGLIFEKDPSVNSDNGQIISYTIYTRAFNVDTDILRKNYQAFKAFGDNLDNLVITFGIDGTDNVASVTLRAVGDKQELMAMVTGGGVANRITIKITGGTLGEDPFSLDELMLGFTELGGFMR